MTTPSSAFPIDGPGADAALFRAVFGRFATGVAIATCAPEDGPPLGVTVNSVASVSLDPPLALFCLEKSAQSLPAFLSAGHFAFNILDASQTALSNRFAAGPALDGLETAQWETGAPILPGALAVADCRLTDAHPGGDHVILVGSVERVGAREGAPLLYYGGDYASLGPSPSG